MSRGSIIKDSCNEQVDKLKRGREVEATSQR